ncbi:MAG: D-alanine--D-alanine ligase [Deltaproteobacteria bacterium]|nr:D-alanine--D-alanine ligase [Deltaproteobacteria bacterium]
MGRLRKRSELVVVFGGRSGEHEVSLRSAVSILRSASPKRYRVTPVGIRKDGTWRAMRSGPAARVPVERLPSLVLSSGAPAALVPSRGGARLVDLRAGTSICRPGVVFPVLHGTYGEDGTIQGLLEMCGVAYVGAGVLGSSVGMDKVIAKRVMRDAGLNIVPFAVWMRGGPLAPVVRESERRFGYPVFVKPANMGSSVGISKAGGRAGLLRALHEAARYDGKVLVEKAIDAREIECAVLGNSNVRASVPGEVVPINDFYDYEAKYLKDGSKTVVPAHLPSAVTRRVRELAVRAFRALACEGMARADFFLDRRNGALYVNEINTIPGFTSISMYPMMWRAAGMTYSALLDRLVALGIERHRERMRNVTEHG